MRQCLEKNFIGKKSVFALLSVFLFNLMVCLPAAIAAVGGSISVTPSATSGVVGDTITFTVKYNAATDGPTLLSSAGVILQWDKNVFALDASSALGTADDNDPHGTSYLDGTFGNLQNNENSRVTVVKSGDTDLLQLRLSDSDGTGDPLNGTTGQAYVNNTRTSSYHQSGAVISDYTMFTVTLKIKTGAAAGASTVTGKVIAVSDNKGSTAANYTAGTADITVAVPTMTVTTAANNQTAAAGSALTTALSVTCATGSTKNSGVSVTFTAPTGAKFATGGSNTETVTTGTDGVATASALTLAPTTIGAQNVTASATGYTSQTFTITATAGAAATMTKTNDAQTGTVGTALTNPFTVTVKDANGNVVTTGTTVTFAVASGSGTLSAASATTDANGQASTTLTLGTTVGANTVTATSGSATTTFSATGTVGAANKLTLTPSATQVSSGVTNNVTLTTIIQDQYGNTVTTASDNVTFTLNATTFGAFTGDSATSTNAASSGIATATFATKATGGTNTINITATSGSLTQATATVETVPFGLDKTNVYLLPSDSYTFTLTGGNSPTWPTVPSASGVLSNTSTAGAKFTAPASASSYSLTVTDTISQAQVTSTANIFTYDAIGTSITSATGITRSSTLQILATGGAGTFNYTSSNTSIGTVAANGLITAVANGTFTVTVTDGVTYNGTTTSNSSTTATVEVVDPIAVTSNATVYLDTATNKTSTITATGGKTSGTYTYKSSDTSAATVSSAGVITAVATGTATITITDATYSNITATVNVVVMGPLSIKVGGTEVSTTQTVGADGTLALATSGGSTNYQYSVTSSPDVAATVTGSGNAYTFTAPTTGAFAGNYTVRLTDTTANLTKDITIYVPLKITVTKHNILESDATQTVTVTGGAAGNAYTLTVLNGSGTADSTGAIATVTATVTAANNTATGNPATSTITPADVSSIMPFTIKAQNSTQTTLEAVTTNKMSIFPTATYSGIIVDSQSAALAGAVLTAQNIAKADGSPYTTSSGNDGSFTISLPQRATGHYNFSVQAVNYLPAIMTGASYSQTGTTANTTTFKLTGASGSISGNVTSAPALASGTTAFVYAYYTSGGSVMEVGPVRVTSAGGGSDPYTIALDNTITYDKVVAVTPGYLAGHNNNSGNKFNISTANATNATLALTVPMRYRVSYAAGPVLTFTEVGGTDISAYTVTAIDKNGAAVAAPTLTTGGKDRIATFTTDQDMTVSLVDAGSNVVFIYIYTKTETAKISATRPGGSTTVELNAGFEAKFDQTAAGGAVAADAVVKDINISLPANGIDLTALETGGAIKSASVDVKVLDIDTTKSAKSSATGSQVVLIDLNIIKNDGTLASDTELNAALKDMRVTIPFDVATVSPGQLENGSYVIYYASSLADFEAGTLSSVASSDIIFADYILGKVTFKVSHLSVFGIGAGSSSISSVLDDTKCFIATAAFGSYQEPHVKLLRLFRDQFLLTNKAGKVFVDNYYHYSPPMADWISKHETVRAMVRIMLLPLLGLSWLLVKASLMTQLIITLGISSIAFMIFSRVKAKRQEEAMTEC